MKAYYFTFQNHISIHTPSIFITNDIEKQGKSERFRTKMVFTVKPKAIYINELFIIFHKNTSKSKNHPCNFLFFCNKI
ncbi:hypothetical protein FEDK69T_01030 [Flavobacterium enshiense DK69]|uniref:Uncharacterized protein n=1 Tax=Flavobacterium enshiense DK69 TaxID=1107311 RepID=V6SEY0_9FLAO|nr:hypothetical protein FEDK69T_01030 [Flavobacterium enshiense DK69]KGO96967.1 hypothetical protein Q767_04540 [Flavobacterium enshiense DK69]